MQPTGLLHVEAARISGRWDNAYSGSAHMVLPPDFFQELQKVPKAKRFFETLDRGDRYAIYHRLQTANGPDIRKKRAAEIISQLKSGKK